MVSFLQLAAERKTPFLVQLKQILGPSYFDRALVANSNKHQVTHMIYVYTLQNENKNRHHVKIWNAFSIDMKGQPKTLFLIHSYISLRSEATKDKVSSNHPSWYQISGGVRIFCLFFAQRSWSECNGRWTLASMSGFKSSTSFYISHSIIFFFHLSQKRHIAENSVPSKSLRVVG